MTKIPNNPNKIKENWIKIVPIHMKHNLEHEHHFSYLDEKCESKENNSNDDVYPSLLSIKISGIEKQVTIWSSKINSQIFF